MYSVDRVQKGGTAGTGDFRHCVPIILRNKWQTVDRGETTRPGPSEEGRRTCTQSRRSPVYFSTLCANSARIRNDLSPTSHVPNTFPILRGRPHRSHNLILLVLTHSRSQTFIIGVGIGLQNLAWHVLYGESLCVLVCSREAWLSWWVCSFSSTMGPVCVGSPSCSYSRSLCDNRATRNGQGLISARRAR